MFFGGIRVRPPEMAWAESDVRGHDWYDAVTVARYDDSPICAIQ